MSWKRTMAMAFNRPYAQGSLSSVAAVPVYHPVSPPTPRCEVTGIMCQHRYLEGVESCPCGPCTRYRQTGSTSG